jgi:large subunit ribosomal protein L18
MANKDLKKRSMRSRRKLRIRKKVTGTAQRPRLAVFRSLRHIHAHLIDDASGQALLGVSSNSKDLRDQLKSIEGKCDKSREVGKALAAKAKEAGIAQAVFDRGGYLYHGRVKALADGAREGGLQL